MTWMNRYAYLPVSLLGAVTITSCSSTAPPPQNTGGTDQAGNQSGSSTGTSSSSGNDGSSGVPDLGGGATTTSGTGSSVPDLGGGATTTTSTADDGSQTSSGTGTSSTTGTAGSTGAGMDTSGSTGATSGTTTDTTDTSGNMGAGGSADGSGTTGAGGSTGQVASGGSGQVASGGSMGTTGGTSLGSIVVSAGDLARDHSIVKFPFPDGQGVPLALVDAQGTEIPLQVSPADGNAYFILESLAAGQQAEYTIVERAQAWPAGVTAAVEQGNVGEQLFVKMGDKQVFRWVLTDDNFRNRSQNDVRSGYIYPLYTPAGTSVADDYAEDHPHMHGIWSAWTNTTFRGHHVDFWNGYADEGRVDLDSMEGAWSGSVHAGLIANLVHLDITVDPWVTVLNERWIVTVYKTHETAPYYVFDIDSVQETATTDPLVLEQYHYGGFGFRGANEWRNSGNVSYLTSEGHTRASGDGQNASWCAQYGDVNGDVGGFAGLDHPDNFRHPQGLRIHPSNPYWAFVPVTPLKGGRFNIEVGVPYHSQYRVVVFDGAADSAFLNQQWSDYANPVTVQVM